MDNKQILMEKLIKTPSIVSMIDSSYNSTPDELIWKNIFPFLFIPDVNEEAKTFVGIELIIPKFDGGLYKDVALQIYIFTHKDLNRTVFGYTRVDYLQCEIDKVLNDSTEFGIDYLKLRSNLLLTANPNYTGKSLTYQVTDFNRGKLRT